MNRLLIFASALHDASSVMGSRTFLLIYSLLTAFFQFMLFFLLYRFVLKKKFRIYESMALAFSYRLFSCMTSAMSFASYARVAVLFNKGRLDELISETLSKELLEEYVSQMQEGFFSVCLAQFFSSLVLLLFLLLSLLMLYKAVKGKKKLDYLYAFLLLLCPLLFINFSELFFGRTAAICVILLLTAGGMMLLLLYLRWYKGEQLRYARQMKEYKDYLKEKHGICSEYTLEYKGRLKSIEEFENIVIRATNDGSLLRLSDVADIELGALNYTFTSSVDKMPGVSFMVNQAAGANATKVNEAINQLYKDMENQLPPGLEFCTIQCSNDFLEAAMDNVIETLVIAIILVVLVVYLFLQSLRATVIPTISIIVSMIGTFAIVKMAGFSLNILTLFALVLAIGTVVDDAIVVVEAVMAKFESGVKHPVQATNQAMHDVFMAVMSCTFVFMIK